ncbi:MAG: HEAT repeat domain-containing protein, partial [Planctomycetaceae bacterium]
MKGRQMVNQARHCGTVKMENFTSMHIGFVCLLAAGWVICVATAVPSFAADPVAPAPAAKTPASLALEAAGIKSDNDSLLAYLSNKSVPLAQTETTELIRQLGNDKWAVRDEATKKLKAMGPAARAALEKAANDPDLEIQARVKEILGQISGQPTAASPMEMVLAVIAERKTPGAVPALLKAIPDMSETLQPAGKQALIACIRPEDTAFLRKALKSDDINDDLRSAVLTALFKLNPDFDAELMKICLTDKSLLIRKTGLKAMAKMPPPDESFVPILVKMLAEDDNTIINLAAKYLAQIGDPSTADALLVVQRKSTDMTLRSNLVGTLVKMRGQKMADTLIELLAEPDLKHREAVLKALGEIYAPQASTAVIGALTDSNNNRGVRLVACQLLASYADPKAVEALCGIVAGDNVPRVRRMAAFALGRIGDAGAVDSLIELLTTDNYKPDANPQPTPLTGLKLPASEELDIYKREAREQAMISLALIGGEKAADALLQASDNSQPEIRGKAIQLLAEMGDKRAADLVIAGLADSNYHVASGAVNACRFIDDPRVVEPLAKFVASNRNDYTPMKTHELGGSIVTKSYYSEAALRLLAMTILNDRWPKEARPVLLTRLKDSDMAIAGRAAEYLAEVNDKSAIPDIINLLENGRGDGARIAAGKSLCKLKVKAAFDPCLDLLQRSKNTSLAADMRELAQASFLDEVEAGLQDAKESRYAILCVAGNLNKPELADRVLPLLNDKDEEVRNAAVTALGGLKNPKAVAPLLKLLQNETDAMARIQAGNVPTTNATSQPTTSASSQPAVGTNVQVSLLAGALGNIGDKSAVDPLLKALGAFQKDPAAATAIAKALGQIGDAAA